MQTRQLLIILGITALAGTMAFIFTRGTRTPTNSDPDQAALVVSNNAIFPKQIGERIIFFDTALQRFRAVSTGVTQDLSTATDVPTNVVYDPTGTVVAVQTASEATTQWHIQDLQSGEIVTKLNSQIQTLTFSPDGKRLLYEYENGTTHNLSISDLNGSNWTALIPISDAITDIHWLQPGTFALYLAASSPPTYHLLGLSSRSDTELGSGDLGVRVGPSGTSATYDNRSATGIDTAVITIGSNGLEHSSALNTHTPGQWATWSNDRIYALALVEDEVALVTIDPSTNERQTLFDATQVQENLFPTTSIDALSEIIGVVDGILFYSINTELRTIQLN